MVKHIVLFKLKETLPQEEKLKVMNDFKAAIEALPAKIGFIRKIFVGLNINSAEAWDWRASLIHWQTSMRMLFILTMWLLPAS